MGAVIAAVVSAVTSVIIALLSVQLATRQQNRSKEHAERKNVNASYLNPLRFQVADNHYRLCDIVRRQVARDRILLIDKPEEVSLKDWTWFNGPGNYLASSAYMMACMFACLQKVREAIPYLRLSSTDDTTLAELILKLQISLVKQGGIQYVTQTSIGQDMWLHPEARMRTYREFCELLRASESRVWIDRVLEFYLETGRGLKHDRTINVIEAMWELDDFLDKCVGGGRAIASRWAAEGLSSNAITSYQHGGTVLHPPDGDISEQVTD